MYNQVLGTRSLNTHFFDGRLETMIQDYVFEDIERVKSFKEEKKIGFDYLRNKKGYTQNGLTYLNSMIDTFHKFGRGGDNYDPLNYLFACDLLYIIYEKILEEDKKDEHDYFDLLVIQLEDMKSGFCPQGRTIRLLQVILMLRDDLTSTSKN